MMPCSLPNESRDARRVLILHNRPTLPADDPLAHAEHEVLDTAAAVEAALTPKGFAVERLALGGDFGNLPDELASRRPDVVFNLFEGLADRPRTEVAVAAMLERCGVPFTGSPARALRIAGAKHWAKRAFEQAGLPTPAFGVVGQGPIRFRPAKWPVIVKPALFDASIGIDQTSVATDETELERQVARIRDRFGPPILVEEFVDGREFAVTLLERGELECLPIVEIEFTPQASQRWPIFSYDGKWRPGTDGYLATPIRYPAPIGPWLADRLCELSRRAYRLLGCRDYARVDLRVDGAGRAFLLEVNPNSDLSPDSFLGHAANAGHLDYDELIADLVENAWARRQVRRTEREPPGAVLIHATARRA